MGFFAVQWTVLLVGFAAHTLLDRAPARRTAGRVFELASLWLLVGMGMFHIWAGIGHTGPASPQVAASIGFAPSMFEWEVGWADIAIGVLGVLCVRRANRGKWTDATLVAWTIALFGDGIGHVVQWVAHDNTAPNNVWAIPTCFLVPVLATVSVHLARRHAPRTAERRVPAAAR